MILPFNVEAKETVRLYLFHSNSCIHCAEEKAYLEKIKKKYAKKKIFHYVFYILG